MLLLRLGPSSRPILRALVHCRRSGRSIRCSNAVSLTSVLTPFHSLLEGCMDIDEDLVGYRGFGASIQVSSTFTTFVKRSPTRTHPIGRGVSIICVRCQSCRGPSDVLIGLKNSGVGPSGVGVGLRKAAGILRTSTVHPSTRGCLSAIGLPWRRLRWQRPTWRMWHLPSLTRSCW